MTKELNSNEEMISLSGKKTNMSVVTPENPSAMVVFLYEDGKNRKHRKSNLVCQIMPKLGFAVISTSYGMNKVEGIHETMNKVVKWVDNSVYNTLPLNIFTVGDGFSELLNIICDFKDRVDAVVIMSNSVPLNKSNLKCKVPVLILGAEEDKENNEASLFLINQDDNPNFEIKIISNASRYYSELGKLGEAINVGGKWFLKNWLLKPDKSKKAVKSVS